MPLPCTTPLHSMAASDKAVPTLGLFHTGASTRLVHATTEEIYYPCQNRAMNIVRV